MLPAAAFVLSENECLMVATLVDIGLGVAINTKQGLVTSSILRIQMRSSHC